DRLEARERGRHVVGVGDERSESVGASLIGHDRACQAGRSRFRGDCDTWERPALLVGGTALEIGAGRLCGGGLCKGKRGGCRGESVSDFPEIPHELSSLKNKIC